MENKKFTKNLQDLEFILENEQETKITITIYGALSIKINFNE
jgi:hypothetical protein